MKILDLSLNWISNDNLTISDGAATIIYQIAILNERLCEMVIIKLIKDLQKEIISSNSTIQMRYLGLISSIHSLGHEVYSRICIQYGGTDALMKACEVQDLLVQVYSYSYYFVILLNYSTLLPFLLLPLLLLLDDCFRVYSKYNVNKYWNRLFINIISFKFKHNFSF